MTDGKASRCATALVAVALLGACTDNSAEQPDLDRAGIRLAEDGAAVVDALGSVFAIEVRDMRVVHDATMDERCGEAGSRRVWRADVVLEAPGADPTDASVVNREFDNLYVAVDAELSERDYLNLVWADSDAADPDWFVFRTRPVDSGEEMELPPLELRTTLQLAVDQAGDSITIDVDIVGATDCMPG